MRNKTKPDGNQKAGIDMVLTIRPNFRLMVTGRHVK